MDKTSPSFPALPLKEITMSTKKTNSVASKIEVVASVSRNMGALFIGLVFHFIGKPSYIQYIGLTILVLGVLHLMNEKDFANIRSREITSR